MLRARVGSSNVTSNFGKKRASVNDAAFRYYPRLERVMTYIDNNIGRPLFLRDAAEVACLEPKYFSSFFRQKVGIRFRVWLGQRRVELAARLIREHDDSLARVASQAGFQSIRTFERAFSRRFRMTPRDYKARVRPS